MAETRHVMRVSCSYPRHGLMHASSRRDSNGPGINSLEDEDGLGDGDREDSPHTRM